MGGRGGLMTSQATFPSSHVAWVQNTDDQVVKGVLTVRGCVAVRGISFSCTERDKL